MIDSVPESARNQPTLALYDALWGEDELAKRRAAKEWMAWGAQVALGNAYQASNQNEHVTEKMVKQARMELHYAHQHYFIKENQILENCVLLSAIDTVIIHGRQDFVCPIEAGMRLHQALPQAQYQILANAGHIAQGEEMIDALVSATDQFIELRSGYASA